MATPPKSVWTHPGEQGSGIYEWEHREEGNVAEFDGKFYALQPRNGVYAASRWDFELTHSGSYPSLGSPNVSLRLRPNVGNYIGILYQMFCDNSGTGYLNIYIEQGGTRVLMENPNTVITRTNYTSDPSLARKRTAVGPMSGVGALGDLRGEDCTLEIYMEHTTATVVLVNMCVMSGESLYYSTDYLR